MGKVWRPRRRPAEAPLEVDGVKDRPQGVGVAVPVGKIMRQPQPRRPAKAPLKSVGVKEDAKRVVASSVGAGGSGVAGSLEEDGTAAVVCLMEEDSLDDRTAVGKVWRPRPQPQRPAKAPLNAVGVKYAQGAVAMASSMLEAPVVAAARGHWDKGPLLEDHGTAAAVCRMDSLDGAPVVIAMTQRHKSVGAVLKKDTKEVALGKVWRPRKPAKKAPLKAVGVKDTKGVDVIGVDDGEVIKASGLGASMVAAEKWPLEDGIAMCRIDTLGGATRQKAAMGLMKDAIGGVVVGKMWQPRRPPVKAPMKAVGVNDTQGVAVITVDGVVEAAKVVEKGPLEDEIAMCLMDSLDQAPVIATTRHEAVEVKNTKGVAVGKMWRPRRPAKDLVQVVGVKDDEGVVVTDVDRKVEASVLLGAPVLMGREKVPLEEGIALCQVDALDGAPVISTTLKEEVAVNNAEGDAVGKRRRPRRSAKKPLEALGVKDAEGVAVITLVGEVEPLVLGVPMAAEVGDREKGPLEDGIVVCPVDALNGAPVIATDEKEEVSVQGDPVVLAAGGREKGSLEDGIVVCRVDALDRAPVISTTREEEVGVKSDEGVVVGKRRRPRRSVKKPLEALGVNDAEGVAVNTLTREVEPLVLGVLVVMEVGGREKGQLEDGIVVCPVDALNAAPVMATDEKEEVWVQGDPVVAEARGGEKGSLEDGIVVCRVDTLKGDPFIATDEKEEVSVQGNPVFPTVDQKVDAPVLERIQTITVKGNGKEDKDKEGIKWLKHYSTAQSILIIGDGDFSFSLALATAFGSGGNLVATSLDTYGALTSKYGKAESNVRELKRLGATVLHGVDAETMKLHPYLEMRRFDRIVFNFPHAGFKGKEYQLHVISSHKQLVRGFLANARQLLRPCGEIHISHKKGFPYDAWGIKKLACESCLIMVQKVDFSKEDYPGYNQKRGDGVTCDDSFPLGPCWTFMFRVGDVEKLKKAHGNRVGLISSCLGEPGKCYPPSISAASMMWPFDLHPTWSQPHFPPVHMPIAFDPCPFGVAGLEDPFNCYGTSFHHQDMVQPTHQGQPWYQEGPPIGTPWTPQEHQSLQKEYEIHRQLTRSLEDRYMESVERQATLEMLIQVYGRH